jgi:hypothetical protein
LIAFGLPSLEEGLEDSLVVKGHGSEAGALKVEVKVHIVLLFVYLLLRLCLLGCNSAQGGGVVHKWLFFALFFLLDYRLPRL